MNSMVLASVREWSRPRCQPSGSRALLLDLPLLLPLPRAQLGQLLLIAQVPLQLALVLLTQPRALLPHGGNEVLQLAVEVVLGLLFRESGLDIRDGDSQLAHDGVHLPSQQADDVDLEAVRDCAASLGHVGDAPSSCRTAHLTRSLTCLGERETSRAEAYCCALSVSSRRSRRGGAIRG